MLALGLKASLGVSQRLAALIPGAQPTWRLIPTIISVALVLLMVSRLGVVGELLDDRDIGAGAVACSAIVLWSGTFVAVITLNATSTSQHRSICREDDTPVAYA